ncbi:YSC84-related protein [uncultured Eudoraea sp.]|uniref:lipid-binding SYLF domain-containing protein n=1 Tax=uncultured Eudoraea sp. TaxID=1035614 RepID=UPI002613995B|nr:YSC84-related protein [uncultured Eudoraea sp.]
MKTSQSLKISIFTFILTLIISSTTYAQVGWNPELEKECTEAIAEMKKEAPKLKTYFAEAYGYAIFPKITKAGLGIGGAGGKGLVYRGNTATGESKLGQASIGLQAGGQQFSELIFFEDKAAYDRFTGGKFKFGAQASAVAITEGGAAVAPYQDGVAIFTHVKGGLMYEASVGGQKFTFEPH